MEVQPPIPKTLRTDRLLGLGLLAALSLASSHCAPAKQPPYSEVVVLTGGPYERGYQHGQRFAPKVQSLFTMLIETNLVPFLNREQNDVMNFLEEYRKPEYQDGKFSFEMMLQSGRNLEAIMEEDYPDEYGAFVEELHGLSDGAQMAYSQILVLNTFVDTMMSFRSVTFFIRQLQSPRLLTVEFSGALAADGIDNNGDGQTDEADDSTVKSFDPGQGWATTYSPRRQAALVEVPTGATVRLVLWDPPGVGSLVDPTAEPKEGDLQGMDPDAIRIRMGDQVWESASDEEIQTAPWGEDGMGIEVFFTPPNGFPAASEVSLYIQAANIARIPEPPPIHPRVMRDERITFTTQGYGRSVHEVVNRGTFSEGTMPPPLGFAVRNSATPDEQIRLAHHFSLLDANISHKHTALFVHRPDDGKAHAVVGWTGLIWGFSGMNEDGLTYMVSTSDTLDNPFAGQVKSQVMFAKLLSTGIPVGIKGRRLLQRGSTVDDGLEILAAEGNTFGWNLLLGDAERDMAVVEMDANVLEEANQGFHTYGPDPLDPGNLDAWGRPYASEGVDDLRFSAHFVKNAPDIDTQILIFDVQPQSLWSTFYYRSVRTHAIVGESLANNYGNLDLERMIRILRQPELVDTNESMNAVIYEPEQLKLYRAMGQVPATDGEFLELDLGAVLSGSAP